MKTLGCSAVLAGSFGLATLGWSQSSPPALTAGEAIARIISADGAAPLTDTVDTVKAGDPHTPVTGVATTFMDSLEMLRQAVAHGDNLIVTHEPTFYNHRDDLSLLTPNDPVLAEKQRYIADHHLVVWRFHDGWHRHVPDGILTGMVEELGLTADQQGGSTRTSSSCPNRSRCWSWRRPLRQRPEQSQCASSAILRCS